jgi:hypothetical protein
MAVNSVRQPSGVVISAMLPLVPAVGAPTIPQDLGQTGVRQVLAATARREDRRPAIVPERCSGLYRPDIHTGDSVVISEHAILFRVFRSRGTSPI